MKADQWIDRVKSAKGIESDYAAAKALHISRNTISRYRSIPATLDEDVALKIAQALGVKPESIVLDQAAERVKDEAVRTALLREAQRLFALCKVPRGSKSLEAQARGAMRRHMKSWPASMH